MNGIHIGTTLVRKRKEKNITQEELAHYLGVSKASVSKWETGASYPDIAFLPQLATYFDISIDDLMNYNPQMNKEEIRSLYNRLTDQVTERPFEDSLSECHEIIKKYYTCYPLLLQMGLFLLNNQSSAPDPEGRTALLHEVIALFKRIQDESGDVALAQLALKLEATCYLALGDADATLVLLENLINEIEMPPGILAASAHQMKGDTVEAKRIIQIGLFQNLVVHFNYLLNYLAMTIDDTEAFNETVKRAQSVASIYDLSHLHPYLQMTFDLTCAGAYAMRDEEDNCLDALERFVKDLASCAEPSDLHGDAYFSLIDPWLKDLDTGAQIPRNKSLVKSDFVNAVSQNPVFAKLADNKRYQMIQANLGRFKTD